MAITNEIIRAIRILALHKSMNPDYDYSYRKICRWYSKEFSVPLTKVYDLSEEEVLQTYFEDSYEKIVSEADSEEGAERLERLKRDLQGVTEQEESQREAEDSAWEQEMLAEIARSEKEMEAENQKGQVSENPNLEEIDSIHKEFEDIPDFDD